MFRALERDPDLDPTRVRFCVHEARVDHGRQFIRRQRLQTQRQKLPRLPLATAIAQCVVYGPAAAVGVAPTGVPRHRITGAALAELEIHRFRQRRTQIGLGLQTTQATVLAGKVGLDRGAAETT